MASDFLELAEELWHEWRSGGPSTDFFSSVPPLFDRTVCPEPYLDFATGDNPLILLTTNPGKPQNFQHWPVIRAGKSVIDFSMDYSSVAIALAEHYKSALTGPARRRIHAALDLAKQAGFDGVFQVETVPFHSSELRMKDKLRLSNEREGDSLLGNYVAALRTFLSDRSVVAITATSTRSNNLAGPEPSLNQWQSWLASLLGLNPKSSKVIPLTFKGAKCTSAAVVQRSGSESKVITQMMGGNNLPGPDGCQQIASLAL